MNAERQDLLISRIVEGEATAREWDELAQLAAERPVVWRTIVEAQRDQASLECLADLAGAVAGRVEAPHSHSRGGPPGDAPVIYTFRRVRTWSGWAVAALVFLAWIVSSVRTSDAPPSHEASLVPVCTSADEALQQYLDCGRAEDRVIREIPRKVLLETRPGPDGHGLELIYLRQVMERAVVPNLYQLRGRTEQGRPALVPWEPGYRGAM